MLECFLVVAMSYNGVDIGRSFETIRDVPAEKASMMMAFAAGQGRATHSQINPRTIVSESRYGYDCGSGWVDRGLKQSDVF